MTVPDMIRLGAIQYANCLPLFWKPELYSAAGIDCIFAPPATINHMILARELDVALMSTAAYLKQRDFLTSDFSRGIATERAAGSVFLYSRVEATALSGHTVAVTNESATAAVLLRLLCHHLWEVTPHFIRTDRPLSSSDYTAHLVIGDRCLTNKPPADFCHLYDLGSTWHAMTHQPFVWALLAAQKSVRATEYFDRINAAMEHSIRTFNVEQHPAVCSLNVSQLSDYLNNFHYQLKKRDLDALEHFSSLLKTAHPQGALL